MMIDDEDTPNFCMVQQAEGLHLEDGDGDETFPSFLS
jgi:hypothetical protein